MAGRTWLDRGTRSQKQAGALAGNPADDGGEREMAGSRSGVRADRSSVLVALTAAGLGFVAASIDPGPGPLTVHAALNLGPFYLPPFLTGLVALAVAGAQARRARWAPAAGAALAAVLLAGALTLGRAAIWWRLAHPGAVLGFAEDTAQVAGEFTALAAGLAATITWRRQAPPAGRPGHRQTADVGRNT
jgi:hypothetical protein